MKVGEAGAHAVGRGVRRVEPGAILRMAIQASQCSCRAAEWLGRMGPNRHLLAVVVLIGLGPAGGQGAIRG